MNPKRLFLAAFLGCLVLVPVIHAQDDSAKPNYIQIQNVNIFDGVNDGLKPGSVLIEDNLIKEVGANVQAPEGTTIIDGGGRTLMPGLIDSHGCN